MAKEEPTKLSGEYRAVDAEYRRKVAVVNARPKLETGIFVFWGALDVVLIFTFVAGVLVYIVSGSFIDARVNASILDNVRASHAGVVRVAPDGLALQDAKSASVVAGKYDLYATVENPNTEWYATFDYQFVFDGGETEIMSGFVNPGDKRLLTDINVSLDRRPSGLRIVTTNLVWSRVDRHAVLDTADFLAERNGITVDEATYMKDLTVGSEQLARSTLTFTNQTAYAYWNPEFLVKLMRGSTILSLSKVALPELQSGEKRTVEVRWFGEVPPSGTIAVEPQIFFFDESVYMDPGDESGQDVRR
ncbi:MAG TPA: hypothetical protein PLK06_02840 [bacterium]|nr:hypothetical protein [bacterium]